MKNLCFLLFVALFVAGCDSLGGGKDPKDPDPPKPKEGPFVREMLATMPYHHGGDYHFPAKEEFIPSPLFSVQLEATGVYSTDGGGIARIFWAVGEPTFQGVSTNIKRELGNGEKTTVTFRSEDAGLMVKLCITENDGDLTCFDTGRKVATGMYTALTIDNDIPRIWLVSRDGKHRKLLFTTKKEWSSYSFDVRPDGKEVAFASGGSVFTIDLLTNAVDAFSPTGNFGLFPMNASYSEDGNRMAYHARTDALEDPQLHVRDLVTKQVTVHTQATCPENWDRSMGPCFKGTDMHPVFVGNKVVVGTAFRGTAPSGCTMGVDCYSDAVVGAVGLNQTAEPQMLVRAPYPNNVSNGDYSESRREILVSWWELDGGFFKKHPILYRFDGQNVGARKDINVTCESPTFSPSEREIICHNQNVVYWVDVASSSIKSQTTIPVFGILGTRYVDYSSNN